MRFSNRSPLTRNYESEAFFLSHHTSASISKHPELPLAYPPNLTRDVFAKAVKHLNFETHRLFSGGRKDQRIAEEVRRFGKYAEALQVESPGKDSSRLKTFLDHFGIEIVFIDSNEMVEDAYVTTHSATDRIIFVNARSEKALGALLAHELMHIGKRLWPDDYQNCMSRVQSNSPFGWIDLELQLPSNYSRDEFPDEVLARLAEKAIGGYDELDLSKFPRFGAVGATIRHFFNSVSEATIADRK